MKSLLAATVSRDYRPTPTLTGRETPLITLPQVRRQVAILEEAHRQSPHIWRRR